MKKFMLGAAVVATMLNAQPVLANVSKDDVVKNYAALVFANYNDAYQDGLALQQAIAAFLEHPTEEHLTKAKDVWLASRDSYGQTEAYRFYEGPIDFADQEKDIEGPEGRLNAWPLNEAYIDYVKGNPTAGIAQDSNLVISKESITSKNQAKDEADVSTGYHAIEFLLWGQDLSLESAGQRPASDYAKTSKNERRRAYLQAVTELLVDDLKFLADSWAPNQDNYAKQFIASDSKQALSHIMTGIATLAGFELSSERLATALDSGDQEDEHSCFSDNTHNDFIMNARGISNVYLGNYKSVKGASLYALLAEKDGSLAKEIKQEIKKTLALLGSLPQPFDREVLATKEGSGARNIAENVVSSLQTQAELFKKAGDALGVDVHVASE